VNKEDNGVKTVSKWLGIIIPLLMVLSMFIGGVVGMTIKSQRIDEAYECSKQNEQTIHEMKEEWIKAMAEIRTDLKYIAQELERKDASHKRTNN